MHDIELFALLLYLFELPQNKMHYFCIYLNLVAILPQFRPGKKSNHSTVVVLCVQISYAGFFFLEKNCSPLVKSDLLLPEFSRSPHGIALIPTVLALWTLDMKVKGKLFAEKSNDSIGIEITYYSWKVGKKLVSLFKNKEFIA